MLPAQAIKEFKEIYLRVFGVNLGMQEATEKALTTFNLLKLLLQKPGIDKPIKESPQWK